MRLPRISNIGNVPGQNFQAVPFKICRCIFYENWLRSSGGQAMGVQGVHYFSQLEFFFFALVMRLLIIYWRLILKPGVVGHYQNQHCQTLF